FDPFPGARGTLDGEVVTCWRGDLRDDAGQPPGQVVAVENDALVVACGKGSLALTELQRAGGRRLPAAEFLRGRTLAPGASFEVAPGGP
ncbi:MAG TPA: methionyl-tRNA formyltransferase, partial [Caldimonas sp.]|nr:methionyl-tRNA formyltransferase [Caldimonas sp.]